MITPKYTLSKSVDFPYCGGFAPFWVGQLVRTHEITPGNYAWLVWRPSTMATLRKKGLVAEIVPQTQGVTQVFTSDRAYLSLVPGARVHGREVIIMVNGMPWMYGRSYVPTEDNKRASHAVSQLGSASLGRLVFTDPTTRRSAFKFIHLNKLHWTHQRMRALGYTIPDQVVGRISTIFWQGQRIALEEVFFPQHPVTQEGPCKR